MIKILGACLILTASSLSGAMVAKKYASRPRELKMFRTALQNLETEIYYSATPLPEALLKIANSSQPTVSPFFAQVYNNLVQVEGLTAGNAWSLALQNFSSKLSLKPVDLNILKNFGSSLGRSDKEDQVKHIHLAVELLKQEINNAEDEAKLSVKMWNYLGFLGGLGLILLLY